MVTGNGVGAIGTRLHDGPFRESQALDGTDAPWRTGVRHPGGPSAKRGCQR